MNHPVVELDSGSAGPSVTLAVKIIGKLSATIGKPVSYENELALKASKANEIS